MSQIPPNINKDSEEKKSLDPKVILWPIPKDFTEGFLEELVLNGVEGDKKTGYAGWEEQHWDKPGMDVFIPKAQDLPT